MVKQKNAPSIGEVVRSVWFVDGFHKDEVGTWVGKGWGDPNPALEDASRANAKYVVTECAFTHATAGTDECWRVTARRLNKDDSFDSGGEQIVFYMESDWNAPYVDEIEVVGRMRPVLTFEKIE